MAPSSTEPRQILVVLNPARRKALYQLAREITAYMHSESTLTTDDDNGQLPEANWSTHQEREGFAVDDVPEKTAVSSNVPSDLPEDILISGEDTRPSAEFLVVRKAANNHFNEWKMNFLVKLKEILAKADDAETLTLRQKRKDKLAQVKADNPADGEDLLKFAGEPTTIDATQRNTKAVEALQAIYHPIPTRLATVSIDDKKEVLSAILLLLLSTGCYSAYSRTFVTYLTSAFEMPLSALDFEEEQIAKTMIEASSEAEKAKQNVQMSAEAEAEKRKQQNKTSRFWKVGLASVAGAALIGVTGGLAAPVVAGAIGGLMGSVGLGGLASFLGIFWMNGALVGTLFGAFGARMTVSFNLSLRLLFRQQLTPRRVKSWTSTPGRLRISSSCL